MKHKKFFSTTLLEWNETNNCRKMPWKGEKDAYKVWISEIILQQTRVEQGLSYYNRFISAFPDISSLANAPEQQVFKLWEGLGYYNRCRNLIASAKYINEKLNNIFPNSYEEIIALRGVGTYTASAIASFAFNKPHAVLDGNVSRVLARFFGLEIPVNSTVGKKYFASLAQELLNKKEPALYNQAIMDFGATVCKPAVPLCYQCPLSRKCFAFLHKKISTLPITKKPIPRKQRFFNYFIVRTANKFYIRERKQKDIWQNLYEFHLWESDHILSFEERQSLPLLTDIGVNASYKMQGQPALYTQLLTHQTITATFEIIHLKTRLAEPYGYTAVSIYELQHIPFPKIIRTFLLEKNYL